MKKKELKKKGDMEDYQEEEEEEGMEEEEEEEKSQNLSADDLEKSIEKLEELAEGEPMSRKEALLAKAQEGELEKAEREELYSLLGGETVFENTLAEEITKGMEENEDLQKALDVSDYLQANQDELKKSLTLLSDHIEKSDKRQHDFNLLLSKSVALIGRQVMDLCDQFQNFGDTPARAPKSKGLAQPLEKGFAGQAPQGNQLSKSEIINTMMAMTEDSMRRGLGGALDDGTDMAIAISKYEQTNSISPQLLDRVKAFKSA